MDKKAKSKFTVYTAIAGVIAIPAGIYVYLILRQAEVPLLFCFTGAALGLTVIAGAVEGMISLETPPTRKEQIQHLTRPLLPVGFTALFAGVALLAGLHEYQKGGQALVIFTMFFTCASMAAMSLISWLGSKREAAQLEKAPALPPLPTSAAEWESRKLKLQVTLWGGLLSCVAAVICFLWAWSINHPGIVFGHLLLLAPFGFMFLYPLYELNSPPLIAPDPPPPPPPGPKKSRVPPGARPLGGA